ncbi:Cryptochrome-1 [Glycine soja]
MPELDVKKRGGYPNIDPPALKRLPRRPRKARRKNQVEGQFVIQARRSNIVRCSTYKEFGHNYRTCQRALVGKPIKNKGAGNVESVQANVACSQKFEVTTQRKERRKEVGIGDSDKIIFQVGNLSRSTYSLRDLRIEENPALAAVAKDDYVFPVYIWCLKEEGQFYPGQMSRWWLKQSLAHLDKWLKSLGAELVLIKTDRGIISSSRCQPYGWNKTDKALTKFVEHHLLHYSKNKLKVGGDFTSLLSSYIHFGELSVRKVFQLVRVNGIKCHSTELNVTANCMGLHIYL